MGQPHDHGWHRSGAPQSPAIPLALSRTMAGKLPRAVSGRLDGGFGRLLGRLEQPHLCSGREPIYLAQLMAAWSRRWPMDADAHLWALATLVAAVLERASAMFLGQAIVETMVSHPYAISILQLLRPVFGGASVPDLLVLLSVTLCQGAALSIPPGFVLPGTRSARALWVIALTLTTFVAAMIVRSVLLELRTQSLPSHPKLMNYLRLMTAYTLPDLLGWFVVSLVSGSLMHWNLRRSSAAGIGQVYARFD
jgi:hypothetical protein